MQTIVWPARRWAGGVLALSMFYTAQLAVTALPQTDPDGFLILLAGFGLAAAMLGLLALTQLTPGQTVSVFLGRRLGAVLVLGWVLVTLVQAGAIGWDTGQAGPAPAGPAWPERGGVLFVLMLLALPAIAEELLYRHFVMEMFDLAHPKGRLLAIVLSTALFAYSFGGDTAGAHMLFMAALGLVLGTARVASGGLLAPILLNAYATGLGLLAEAVL
ncbi:MULTISPECIES: CPBP family intramembrane glutamic endopeptidase [unclassified Pseudomonas]|uniref:CPBP family intramembrane glutamic endopeptidase n=1 Tax=unclassified Pseudomonas TaxID=196821 RepID=UPI000BDA3267|nr:MULTISPECIES: CPBP family intramembrane glutamic endopeptidase [unclassified Pseudomonas]PVZ12628.1 hypothetical protein F474_03433 [Pseudomonas sp. URIL14HWK12:I12]PVZ23221.1 hypothetical protein F470_02770 [Pseudomonas sp. URIL14HWK12:I10]PVZ32550.1 hypothetical protein F472_03117 [Pseudomonas sp. URIL14HWK12:I11]SNZ13648.1 CAAX protease self-immunity [Pseudomonas sp. URIL14HWK12:I9]